jgi:hypothetical protein
MKLKTRLAFAVAIGFLGMKFGSEYWHQEHYQMRGHFPHKKHFALIAGF